MIEFDTLIIPSACAVSLPSIWTCSFFKVRKIFYVTYEDGIVKITVNSFYERKVNWADRGPTIEKVVSFTFENKTDEEIFVGDDHAYAGDERINASRKAECRIAAGKKATIPQMYYYPDGSDKLSLDTLDSLYTVEGEWEIHLWSDPSGKYMGKVIDTVPYKLSTLKNNAI